MTRPCIPADLQARADAAQQRKEAAIERLRALADRAVAAAAGEPFRPSADATADGRALAPVRRTAG